MPVTVEKHSAEEILASIEASKENGRGTISARFRESQGIRNFIAMTKMNQINSF